MGFVDYQFGSDYLVLLMYRVYLNNSVTPEMTTMGNVTPEMTMMDNVTPEMTTMDSVTPEMTTMDCVIPEMTTGSMTPEMTMTQ